MTQNGPTPDRKGKWTVTVTLRLEFDDVNRQQAEQRAYFGVMVPLPVSAALRTVEIDAKPTSGLVVADRLVVPELRIKQ
jgi:hypothetical protein